MIGGGIAGLSAAWLLARRHAVVVYEREPRLGGHSHTVDVAVPEGRVAVDTGFIVHNEVNYPNLVELFRCLGVATRPSDMSFAVSLDGGRFEYAGGGLAGLLAQPANVLRPAFWSMVAGIVRFYREAAADPGGPDETIAAYLADRAYPVAFAERHLIPMASAIWSAPAADAGGHPAAALIGFFEHHGLLRLSGRPRWRTVTGGSRAYVERLAAPFAASARLGLPAARVARDAAGVTVIDGAGHADRFDHVVMATHADVSLGLLADADEAERAVLGAFRYASNEAVLHTDPGAMPRRRRAWSSWNVVEDARDPGRGVAVTYWMNRLQGLATATDVFVSLNPRRALDPARVIGRYRYDHPLYDVAAIRAQARLDGLQGRHRTWFCGAYAGAGFHEDGLRSGLAVAEALGGARRPWAEAPAISVPAAA